MNAKEFRLNNLAQDQDGNLLKVIGVKSDPGLKELYDIFFYVIDRSKFPLNSGWKASPIPITEEWLLKFGFDKDGDDLIIDLSSCLLVWHNDDEFVHLKSNSLETIVSVNHVHQLQNLYFALTGKDLEFTN